MQCPSDQQFQQAAGQDMDSQWGNRDHQATETGDETFLNEKAEHQAGIIDHQSRQESRSSPCGYAHRSFHHGAEGKEATVLWSRQKVHFFTHHGCCRPH